MLSLRSPAEHCALYLSASTVLVAGSGHNCSAPFSSVTNRINTGMRLSEIQPAKPKTPEQQKVASLKATANRANAAVKAERARQQQRKAQQALAQAQKPSALA